MTPKQFIEKAIEGGYDCYLESGVGNGLSDMFLDPKSWEAVGKVEGWKTKPMRIPKFAKTLLVTGVPMWHHQMYWMIDALCEGKSIEQFLETL